MNHADFALLVVDDDAASRDMLATRLARKGFRVATAAGGAEALELIQRQTFDCVLLDFEMPGLSGPEVLCAIRQVHSPAELPVIMTTGRDEGSDRVVTRQHGANDYVTKPIDFPRALAQIQAQLAQKGARA